MSALVSRVGLNEQQIAFVQAFMREGDSDVAATEAGYRGIAAGNRLMALPHVLAVIHAETQRALTGQAVASLRTLVTLRDSSETPARVRADIGLQIMKMAGHVVPSNKTDTPGKQLSEMTQAEMLDYIERNQAEIDRAVDELAARAKPVSAQVIAQDPPQADAKPLSYLD